MLRSYSAVGRDRHSCALAALARLSALAGSLRACAFICGDLDGLPENGERGWRRGFCALLRNHIGFEMLSAGRTLGQKVEAALRPRPRLRQRAIGSLDSLHLGRGVGAFCAARGTRVQRGLVWLQ